MGREKSHRSRKHRDKAESSPEIPHKSRKSSVSQRKPHKSSRHSADQDVPSKPPKSKKRKSSPELESEPAAPKKRKTIKPVTEEEAPQHGYATRLRTNSSAMKEPSKGVHFEKKGSKVRKTVSAASIFTQKAKVDAKYKKHKMSFPETAKEKTKDKTKKMAREKTPEHGLSIELHGQHFGFCRCGDTDNFSESIKEARNAINASLIEEFTNAYGIFLDRLVLSRKSDESFFEKVSTSMKTFCEPLSEEDISREMKRDGQIVIETDQLGSLIKKFKDRIEKEQGRLENGWKQWDALQNDFIDLGVDIFGCDAFVEGLAEQEDRETGFKVDMEKMDRDHSERVNELADDVENVRVKTSQKMKASEMVCC